MTAGDHGDPRRFRLLATHLAGRSLGVIEAAAGEAAYTDGESVFVSAGRPPREQRREVLCQAALLGAGSLEPEVVRALRGRPNVTRRYLALEGRRVLADLADRVALAATLGSGGDPATASAVESLQLAGGRRAVPDPPAWFGVIRPSRLLGAADRGPGGRATDRDLRLRLKVREGPEAVGDDDEQQGAESRILKLFQNPLSNSNALTNFLSKMLGMSRSPGGGSGGGEMPVGSIRRVDSIGPNARPLPVPLRFVEDDTP
ncbi:MAG TPA: VWA domain-containing protein, partial [Acidimicrobiia bacterium]|nr:VWA domain-containing protein [Acidimicrobiia bacterium]